MSTSIVSVLVVDSSPNDRATICQLLRAAPGSYIVTEADRDELAISLCATTRPDCVLLDRHLPDREFLEVLTTIHMLRAMPIIIMAQTELNLPGDRERYLAAGATAYMAKPVSSIALIATLAQVLSRNGRTEMR